VKLKGATVLVTGATGGIGHAIARRLKAEGADLVLTGRNADVLAPLAAELGARSIVADLGEGADVTRLLSEAGPIDILVANAALPGAGDLVKMSEERIDANLDVNLRSPIMMARALIPQLAARGTGHLVFIGSVSGIVASPVNSLYAATKFGLRGFAAALRQDLRPLGIGVSIVQPGFVRGAGMFVNSQMDLPRGTRTTTPEKVAAGVVKAITKNRGEIVVAPPELRVGARFGSIFPSVNDAAQRQVGAIEMVSKHAYID
jgi:short-subunit dehydrogenase